MADVRLTATNPADSSVVPVACNEKGELKLEEIPDQSFDGNLQGDLTVSGRATFTEDVRVGGKDIFTYLWATGRLSINRADNEANEHVFRAGTLSNQENVIIKADGSATFAKKVTTKGFVANNYPFDSSIIPLYITSDTTAKHPLAIFTSGFGGQGTIAAAQIDTDGSATFAGNKAGFTAEGHLWCTTRRGDTVILDVTSNGLASWVPYTPPNRLTELQDKWAEKNGIRPMPEESSQDEPETTQ